MLPDSAADFRQMPFLCAWRMTSYFKTKNTGKFYWSERKLGSSEIRTYIIFILGVDRKFDALQARLELSYVFDDALELILFATAGTLAYYHAVSPTFFHF